MLPTDNRNLPVICKASCTHRHWPVGLPSSLFSHATIMACKASSSSSGQACGRVSATEQACLAGISQANSHRINFGVAFEVILAASGQGSPAGPPEPAAGRPVGAGPGPSQQPPCAGWPVADAPANPHSSSAAAGPTAPGPPGSQDPLPASARSAVVFVERRKMEEPEVGGLL